MEVGFPKLLHSPHCRLVFMQFKIEVQSDVLSCHNLPSGENLFIDSTSFGSRRPFNPKPLPFLSKRFLWEIGYNETSVRRFTTGNSSIFCGKSKIVNQNKLKSKIEFNLVSKTQILTV